MVKAGKGELFDPGHGRRVNVWLVVQGEESDWIGIAKEACEFMRSGNKEH